MYVLYFNKFPLGCDDLFEHTFFCFLFDIKLFKYVLPEFPDLLRSEHEPSHTKKE
jgi:hypothetical protein